MTPRRDRGGGERLIGAIVQARMGSTRLPGKVLADLRGKPMLQRVLERVKAASRLDTVVLATTVDERDTPLIALAQALQVATYRGSVDDVLDRYYRAANAFGLGVVVRVTGDNPLIDPGLIDRILEAFLEGGCDYASNVHPVPTFPDGLDVEVLSAKALERAWREASLPSDREHVGPYVRRHPGIFRMKHVANPEDLSMLRWTVDEERDLRFIREVYAHLEDGSGRVFGMREVLDLLARHPEISVINAGIPRDEGYQQSLQRDRERSR